MVVCTGATVAAQQTPGYTERVDVTRVLIDARVLDDHGQPVRGLGAEDFLVKIGGKAARVESVLWVGSVDEAPLESRHLSASPRVGETIERGRFIVFVFQKSLERSRIVGLMRMLIEARGLLDTLTPHDRVAVLSFDSHLRVWLDFTNDYDRVRRIFERSILFEHAAAVQESEGPSLVRRLHFDRARRTYTIESALRRVGEALADLPGAKSIVLVGHGFGRLGRSGVYMENEYDEMRAALQAARASVFSLDVTDADYHSLEAGLQLVADDTGGFFARTHIFSTLALNRLSGALAGHYVLFVERPSLEPGAHQVSVTLTRAKGDVLAKRSYVAVTETVAPATRASPILSGPSRASCAATTPANRPFVPPAPYPPQAPGEGTAWYGTDALWTVLDTDGTWRALPHDDEGYRQKVFLWRPGYDGRVEQWPEVMVAGQRLDADAPPLFAEPATNAYRRDFGGWAMLVGVEVPTPGCWQLTATYRGASVTFIVRVEP